MKGKKTGGRQKGAKNKSTIVREEGIAASGELPRDYMLRVMRDPTVEHTRRDVMARSVAPYIHASLSAVTAEVKHSISDRLERAIARAAERK